ncbi:MAG: DUF3467 domain-containing protein [Desulfobacterales bacterium]
MRDPIQHIPPKRSVEGKYANYYKIGHNTFEFILDFGQLHPDTDQVAFHTRIITSPASAKELLGVLQDSIARYERAYGIIAMNDDNSEWT